MLNACSLGAGQSRFDASAMDSEHLSDLTVVVPNLHWRYSGVTATNRMVAPRLARLLSAGWFGSDAPEALHYLGAITTVRGGRRASSRFERDYAADFDTNTRWISVACDMLWRRVRRGIATTITAIATR